VSWPALIATMLFGATAWAGTLAEYQVSDGALAQPLTNQPGVPARGRTVVLDPARGNCLICHPMPIAEAEFQGDVGPDLAGVASRYSASEIRLRVVDAKRLNPDSIMPAYYRVEGLYWVLNQYRGKPILTAQEVEDVVAYLMTLQGDR
jgi:L-cysteine S-thiosulfotransferase